MATDKWIEYNGQEVINLSRTAQLAAVLGIDTVWVDPTTVEWIQTALGGVDYDDITEAPWYDPGYPASMEFAGLISLGMPGLDDSTLESVTIEYIGDGGNSGKPRNKTLPIVASVAIVASTDRGAAYGKRWLDRILRAQQDRVFCSGADLTYFLFDEQEFTSPPPQMHRRDVSLTRAASVTRKRTTPCSATWLVTYTWTANDPYEYGVETEQITSLGGEEAEGPGIASSGDIVLVQEPCPVFDYSPIYDPLFPALVPSPTAPDLLPDGWGIVDGMTFDRFWAILDPVEPTSLNVVPLITLTTGVVARMVRVAIWDSSSATTDQCDPLFSAVVSYLPPDFEFVIDGEQKASYVWDGVSSAVRRTDSLVYSQDANPVEWTSFNDPVGLMVTLDIFADSSGYQGDGDVRLALSFVSKSD